MLTVSYPVVLMFSTIGVLARFTDHWTGDDMTAAAYVVVFGWYAVGPAFGFIPFIYVFLRWRLFGRYSVVAIVVAYVCYDLIPTALTAAFVGSEDLPSHPYLTLFPVLSFGVSLLTWRAWTRVFTTRSLT